MNIYFSGNGNSAAVAESLADLLQEKKMLRIGKSLIDNPEVSIDSDEERIVWVVPVHAWGLPAAVAKFMENVKFHGKSLPHYLVVTCGDDTGYVDKEWRGYLERKGYETRGCWHVIMPNTFVTLPGFDVDDDATAERKLRESVQRIKYISEAIEKGSGEVDLYRGNSRMDAWLKSTVLRFFFRKFCMSPQKFRASHECISCGICVKSCPLGNITMKAGERPEWGNDCTFCLGCYNRCPRHAVRYGKATDKKGQWRLKK